MRLADTVIPANLFIRSHVFTVALYLFNMVAYYQGAFALFRFLWLYFGFNSLSRYKILALIIITDGF